jgi:hypothetical protein
MKNIHLIPTDKPSRLYEFGGEYHLQIKSQENFRSQNIYITSDEEIKEGDWIIYKNKVSKIERGDNELFHLSKKIILTTDLDLIKDGVQAIDDTFLEWFVKNPSCESVKTDLVPVNYFGSEITVNSYGFDKFIYKIIIQKKDWLLNNPQCKQIESCSKSLSKKCICPKEELKQETLEEAADSYSSNPIFRMGTPRQDMKRGFELGAKWQEERMYSEEEVKELCKKSRDEGYDENTLEGIGANEKIVPFGEWFEQFKKK